jgi:predicted MFS family arabinose efflux permease
VLDVSLLRRCSVLGANVATLLTFTAMMGSTFLAPLVLIGLYGYSLGRTALALSATSILILVVAIVSGRAVDRIRIWAVGVFGFVVVAGSLWGFSYLGPAPAFGSVLLVAGALGVGIGIVLPPLTTLAMSGTSTDQLEDASALFSTFRQIGLALGVAVFGSLAAALVGHELAAAGLGSGTGLVDLSVARLGQASAGQAPSAVMSAAIWRGLAETFRIGGAIVLLATVPLLLSDLRWRITTPLTMRMDCKPEVL